MLHENLITYIHLIHIQSVMGALRKALTSGRRLVAMVAVFSAIAFALFMCAGVGSVAAEEVVLEVPSTLAATVNNTTAASGVYFGLSVTEWVIGAAGILALIAFFIMKDFRILIIAAALLIIMAIMAYV